MVRLQVILVTVSMVCSQALHARMETRAINWKLYAIPQLLAQKEQSKNNPDLVAQIDQELANRGFVATITLAKAPEGQEWVLKDKNITLEKPLGAPTERPSGAGEGQWFLIRAENWLASSDRLMWQPLQLPRLHQYLNRPKRLHNYSKSSSD